MHAVFGGLLLDLCQLDFELTKDVFNEFLHLLLAIKQIIEFLGKLCPEFVLRVGCRLHLTSGVLCLHFPSGLADLSVLFVHL